jgi:hypothetical protein
LKWHDADSAPSQTGNTGDSSSQRHKFKSTLGQSRPESEIRSALSYVSQILIFDALEACGQVDPREDQQGRGKTAGRSAPRRASANILIVPYPAPAITSDGGFMPRRILFDQFRLTVYVPTKIQDAEAAAMTRILTGVRFRTRLRRAVATVFRRYRSLRPASSDVAG